MLRCGTFRDMFLRCSAGVMVPIAMKDRLTRGAFWLAATRLLVNGIGVASMILLARLLLPEDFGLVAIATTIAIVAGSITELSLSSALVQHDNPEDRHFDSAWTLNVLRAALLAVLMAALARPVARFYGDVRLTDIMFVLAATSFLGGFGNPKLVIFTRNLVFWQEFAIGVSTKVLGFIVAIAIAVTYKSYWALIAGGAAAQLLTLVLSYVLMPYRPRLHLDGGRELLGFSVWLTLGQIVRTSNYRADTLLAGYFLGSHAVGYYSFGDNLAALPTREATAPIAQTLFPAFAQLKTNPVRLRQAYQRAQALLSAIALPIGCGFAMIAQPFVLLTVGEKWAPAVIVIQVLASILALQTLGAGVQSLAMSLGKTQALLKRDIWNLLVRLPLMLVGLAMGGLVGLVYARFVSGLFNLFLNMGLVRRLLDLSLRDQLRVNVRSLLGAAVMMLGLGLIQALTGAPPAGFMGVVALGGLIVAGAALYSGAVGLMWLLAGRPEGPESEMIVQSKRLWASLRRSSASVVA